MTERTEREKLGPLDKKIQAYFDELRGSMGKNPSSEMIRLNSDRASQATKFQVGRVDRKPSPTPETGK